MAWFHDKKRQQHSIFFFFECLTLCSVKCMDVWQQRSRKGTKNPECKVKKLINNIWYNSLSTCIRFAKLYSFLACNLLTCGRQGPCGVFRHWKCFITQYLDGICKLSRTNLDSQTRINNIYLFVCA